MITVRPEQREDWTAIRRIIELAFGRRNEADLVDALRSTVTAFISLVALDSANVVGHIFFSPVTVESVDAVFSATGLAPLAVLPSHQNQGAGSLLVREGLNECRSRGYDIVVVLGHPHYYPRFGFVPAGTKGLRCEYDVPDEVFMVNELEPGALDGRRGLVKYHAEFGRV